MRDPGWLLASTGKKPGSRVCTASLRFATCCTAPGTRGSISLLVNVLGDRDDVLVGRPLARLRQCLPLGRQLVEVDDRIGVLVRVVSIEPCPEHGDRVRLEGQEFLA